jgi:hypoxanthine phosphoribosyltransferase
MKRPTKKTEQARRPKKPASKSVPRMISIPSDVVLSPSSEGSIPEPLRGSDRSSGRAQALAELSWSQFDRRISSLAQKIAPKFQPDAVVGIAHGGLFVGAALARALEVAFFPVHISRRSRDRATVLKTPRSLGEMPPELKGKKVLLVDDVVSSGDTLQLGEALLSKVGCRDVRTACLVQREEGYAPDWSGMVSDGLLVFPWDYEPVTEDDRFNR